jgi:protein O-GlcNAc transferase
VHGPTNNRYNDKVTMNLNETIKSAIEHYQAGNLKHAENICHKVLRSHPQNSEVLHLLGLMSSKVKNYDLAAEYITKALQFNPEYEVAYFNLGNVLKEKGQLNEAITCYQEAIRLNPHFAEAHSNLGSALQDKGDLDQAIVFYQKAIQLNPHIFFTFNNLGTAFRIKGKNDEAITCYQEAIRLNPHFAEAHSNLGSAFQDKGDLDQAIVFYQKAIQLNPDNADLYSNLGTVFADKGELDNSISCHQKAIQLSPGTATAYNNLGTALQKKGKINEAEHCLRRAVQIDPHNSNYYSNYLLTMLYNSNHDAKTIYLEHLEFSRRYAESLNLTVVHHSNERDPSRQLKIGYVSPDFRSHSVSYFIEAVLMNHNREKYAVFCYSNSAKEDEVTKRLKEYADKWQYITGISDDEAANVIRKDGIDILIDIAGHTAGNRLLVFVRKPAPIQISWIGYPATTGLSAIDYKIVDDYTDPVGKTEQLYSEKLIRLPESFLVYLPDTESPEVGPLPALSTGHVTFGSFNNFSKLTPAAFSIWARILYFVPNSRLILKWRGFSDRTVKDYAINMFRQRGITEERIILLDWDYSSKEHLGNYNRVDLGLDTFPYNGTTTTCEAMWMGVPVITLAGTSHASRVGVSLLSNVGLERLVAHTEDDYVRIAVELAADIGKLNLLRRNLRNIMEKSPLIDASRFIISLEKCYRDVWENWCTE